MSSVKTKFEKYIISGGYKNHSFSFHFALYAIYNIGNIEKCHLLVKLEVVSPDSRMTVAMYTQYTCMYIHIYIYTQKCGVSFCTCWREILGD